MTNTNIYDVTKFTEVDSIEKKKPYEIIRNFINT